MICPKCAYLKTTVEGTIKGLYVRRWRKCPKCGATFSTVELLERDRELEKYSKDLFDSLKEEREK